MIIQFAEDLVAVLSEERAGIAEKLSDGAAKSYEDYKLMVGRCQQIDRDIETIKSQLKKATDDDD